MSVKLPSLEKRNLRESFFDLLKDFSTFPAAGNFFLVSFTPPKNRQNAIPDILTDENQKKLGITKASQNIDKARIVYEKYISGSDYMYLVNGIDLTTEKLNVNNRGGGEYPNGLLPVGPFTETRDYPDTDLDIQFSETNISFVDTIIRPWIQLYSVYGNIDIDLTTNLEIYFIAKEQLTTRKTFKSIFFGESGGSPVVRKIYKYRDCIPYNIVDANVAQYSGDSEIGSVAVKWRFSTYDVITPIDGKL